MMRNYHVRCGLGLLALLAIATPLQAHPFHATYAEVDWNETGKVLEVALRVQPEDLERVLSLRAKRRIDIEKTKGVDKLIHKYLTEVFVVEQKGVEQKKGEQKGGGQKSVNMPTLRWVGKEVSAKEAWLYFELPRPAGAEDLKILNQIFFEILPDQVNTVRFRQGKKRTTLRFDRNSRKPVAVTAKK